MSDSNYTAMPEAYEWGKRRAKSMIGRPVKISYKRYPEWNTPFGPYLGGYEETTYTVTGYYLASGNKFVLELRSGLGTPAAVDLDECDGRERPFGRTSYKTVKEVTSGGMGDFPVLIALAAVSIVLTITFAILVGAI